MTLQTTKKQFVEFTEQQALDFVKVTVDFRNRMNANGPVKCDDLDIGLALLVEFQASERESYLLFLLLLRRCMHACVLHCPLNN